MPTIPFEKLESRANLRKHHQKHSSLQSKNRVFISASSNKNYDEFGAPTSGIYIYNNEEIKFHENSATFNEQQSLKKFSTKHKKIISCADHNKDYLNKLDLFTNSYKTKKLFKEATLNHLYQNHHHNNKNKFSDEKKIVESEKQQRRYDENHKSRRDSHKFELVDEKKQAKLKEKSLSSFKDCEISQSKHEKENEKEKNKKHSSNNSNSNENKEKKSTSQKNSLIAPSDNNFNDTKTHSSSNNDAIKSINTNESSIKIKSQNNKKSRKSDKKELTDMQSNTTNSSNKLEHDQQKQSSRTRSWSNSNNNEDRSNKQNYSKLKSASKSSVVSLKSKYEHLTVVNQVDYNKKDGSCELLHPKGGLYKSHLISNNVYHHHNYQSKSHQTRVSDTRNSYHKHYHLKSNSRPVTCQDKDLEESSTPTTSNRNRSKSSRTPSKSIYGPSPSSANRKSLEPQQSTAAHPPPAPPIDSELFRDNDQDFRNLQTLNKFRKPNFPPRETDEQKSNCYDAVISELKCKLDKIKSTDHSKKPIMMISHNSSIKSKLASQSEINQKSYAKSSEKIQLINNNKKESKGFTKNVLQSEKINRTNLSSTAKDSTELSNSNSQVPPIQSKYSAFKAMSSNSMKSFDSLQKQSTENELLKNDDIKCQEKNTSK